MKKSLFTLLMMFPFLYSAQYQGTYTVGPQGDFATIEIAIDSLKLYGFQGDVTLEIPQGNYPGVEIVDMLVPAGLRLTIKGVGAYRGVRFESMTLERCTNIQLEGLTLYRRDQFVPHTVLEMSGFDSLRIVNCQITDSIIDADFSSDATLKIRNNGSSSPFNTNSVVFDSCHIFSWVGQQGNSANTTIDESGSLITYLNDTITGKLREFFLYDKRYIKCQLELYSSIEQQTTQLIDSCLFNLNTSAISIEAQAIYNSTFNFVGYMRAQGNSLTVNCEFNGPLAHMDGLEVLRSTFNCDVEFNYGNRFHHNKVYGDFDYNASGSFYFYDNYLFGKTFTSEVSVGPVHYYYNNFFFDDFRNLSTSSWMHHNSFAHGTTYFVSGTDHKIENNILSKLRVGSVTDLMINGNNYLSTDPNTLDWAAQDIHAKFINPLYLSQSDLHIQNPSLFGCIPLSPTLFTDYDIDDDLRSVRPSPGADESCIKLPLLDTLSVMCGSKLSLKNCEFIENYEWGPASMVNDSSDLFPFVRPTNDFYLYLYNNGNLVDSTYLVIDSLESGSRMDTALCAEDKTLYSVTPDGYLINWEPASGVAGVNDPRTLELVDTNTMFVAIKSAPSCPKAYDTIYMVIDNRPVVEIDYDFNTSNCKTFVAQTNVNCSDSVRWDFGDGVFSNNDQVSHTFMNEGLYVVVLTAWHHGESSQATWNFYAQGCLGIAETNSTPNLIVFPNPSTGQFFYEIDEPLIGQPYHVYDLNGRTVFSGSFDLENGQIDLDLSPGTYFLDLKNNHRTLKLMVH